MKFNKIAMVFVLLLFAIGTIVPAALSVDSVADLQSKYDESNNRIGVAFDKIANVDQESDVTKAKAMLNEAKVVFEAELIVFKQIRSAVEDLIAKGDNSLAAQDLLAKLNGSENTGVNDLIAVINQIEKKKESFDATAALPVLQQKFYNASVKWADQLDPNKGAIPDLAKSIENEQAVSVVKVHRDAVKALTVTLKEVRTEAIKYMDNSNVDFFVQQDFVSIFVEVDSPMYLNQVADNKEVELVYLADAYVAGNQGFDVEYKALQAKFVTLKVSLNAELCASNTGSDVMLSLKGLAVEAAEASIKAKDYAFVAESNVQFTLAGKLIDWQTKFNSLSQEIINQVTTAKATDCSTGNGTDPVVDPVVPPVVLTEWEQYEALDKAFDDAEDDFDDYDAKLEKARDDKDSKDIKKYEGKLEDLSDDTVSDLINDAEDLLDKVEKDKTIENQKLLINKVEDLIDDLESLEDDIKKAIKGTTNSSSNVSSTGSNFVAAKTSTTSSTVPQNAVTGNTVQKISGFPTTGVPQNAVTSTTDKAEFVEIALLVGGLVLVTLVIMFLLAVLLFKK